MANTEFCTVRRNNADTTTGYNEPQERIIDVIRGLPCRLELLSGRELENALQMKATLKWKVSYKIWKGAEPKDWFVPNRYPDKKLEIHSITHDEGELDYVALCTEEA